jgi:hypothetical protein
MHKKLKNTLWIFAICISTSNCSIFKPKKQIEEIVPTVKTDISMEKPSPKASKDALLMDIVSDDPFLKNIINNSKEYNVQIMYTKIDRNTSNIPKFSTYNIDADPDFYFYPASMVKMPIAFLALQKINELQAKGIFIDKYSTMLTDTSTENQTAVYNDPTTIDGKPCIAQYVKKIFLTSDNDASNRLYEFLGQEYIISNLQRLGFKSAEILHRLAISLPFEENKITNPIKFLDSNGNLIYTQPAVTNSRKYSKRNDFRGVGYMSNDTKVEKAFNFSQKNRLSLTDMHGIIKAVVFPESVEEKNRFNLTIEDRNFLLQYMSQLPKESNYPSYNPKEVWDNYVKFNLFGSDKKAMPSNIRVFNKVGYAYGYFTDASYIVDFENNVEFLLSATIYANKDGIFNDDKYDEEDIAMPFFKKLGEAIYNFELKRKKTNAPDLSAFKMVYDK